LKWLALLAGSVGALILALLLLPSPRPERGPLSIPSPTAGRDELIQSAQQFSGDHVTPQTLPWAIRLMRALHDQIGEEDWGAVNVAAFQGWEALRKASAAQEGLAPIVGSLVSRLARWAGSAQLEAMVGHARGNDPWKEEVDQALLREAGRPIPPPGYEGSRPALLVELALRGSEVDRAAAYLAKVRFEETVSAEGRKGVTRMADALGALRKAKSGIATAADLVRGWKAAEGLARLERLVEQAGLALIAEGLDSWDAEKVIAAIEPGAVEEQAAAYWKAVLAGLVGLAQGTLRARQSEKIRALVAAIGKRFQEPGFEHETWLRLGEEEKGRDPVQATWRIECLKRSALAARSDAQRLELARRIAGEWLALNSPDQALAMTREIAGRVEADPSKSEILAMAVDLQVKADGERVRVGKEQEQIRDDGIKKMEARSRDRSPGQPPK
jgi:hypothetical protein